MVSTVGWDQTLRTWNERVCQLPAAIHGRIYRMLNDIGSDSRVGMVAGATAVVVGAFLIQRTIVSYLVRKPVPQGPEGLLETSGQSTNRKGGETPPPVNLDHKLGGSPKEDPLATLPGTAVPEPKRDGDSAALDKPPTNTDLDPASDAIMSYLLPGLAATGAETDLVEKKGDDTGAPPVEPDHNSGVTTQEGPLAGLTTQGDPAVIKDPQSTDEGSNNDGHPDPLEGNAEIGHKQLAQTDFQKGRFVHVKALGGQLLNITQLFVGLMLISVGSQVAMDSYSAMHGRRV